MLNQQITPIQGLGVEAIITFILLLTIFASIDSKRKDLGGSFPLSIGFALVVGALFGVGFTFLIIKNYFIVNNLIYLRVNSLELL